MSNTDIYPPRVFSTPAPLVQKSQSRTFPWQDWSAEQVYTTSNVDVSGSESRLSQSTFGYYHASETGNLPENTFGYTMSMDRKFRGVSSYETKGINGGYFADRYFAEGTFPDANVIAPTTVTIPTLLRQNLDNMVLQKVLQKVKDQDVNIAVAYAERERTLQMLGSTLGRLAHAYNLARQGKFKAAAAALTGQRHGGVDVAKSLSAGWLELQYGWLPLMSDIYGLCKTLHKHMTHREYVVVRARKLISEAIPKTEITHNGAVQEYTVAETRYEASVRVKMKSSSTLLATASEVGLTNPAEVAWELVPFSFVVDWAVPIGTFLGQFDAALGWHFETGSITRFYKRRATKTVSVAQVPSNCVYYTFSGNRYVEELEVSRTGISSWVEMLSLPAVKDPASFLHIANALALITQKR